MMRLWISLASVVTIMTFMVTGCASIKSTKQDNEETKRFLEISDSLSCEDLDFIRDCVVNDAPCVVRGTSINTKSVPNYTFLRMALKKECKDVFANVIEAGANVNQARRDWSSLLRLAVYDDLFEFAELLLMAGANPNSRSDSISPLDRAIYNENTDMVELLLKHGADPNLVDKNGNTALGTVSSYKQNFAILELLMDADADVNIPRDNIYLYAAASNGRADFVRVFLDAGAGKKKKAASSAFRIASAKGYLTIVNMLLDGASVDVNSLDSNGENALIRAAWGGHAAIVKRLLETKIEINQKSRKGRTALEVASWRGHQEVMDLLIGEGIVLDENQESRIREKRLQAEKFFHLVNHYNEYDRIAFRSKWDFSSKGGRHCIVGLEANGQVITYIVGRVNDDLNMGALTAVSEVWALDGATATFEYSPNDSKYSIYWRIGFRLSDDSFVNFKMERAGEWYLKRNKGLDK
ncbi:ankyrin repeat domain-containing protein [bacterium]|nr:ankyrin repeat domain-containing protein [bacterium]